MGFLIIRLHLTFSLLFSIGIVWAFIPAIFTTVWSITTVICWCAWPQCTCVLPFGPQCQFLTSFGCNILLCEPKLKVSSKCVWNASVQSTPKANKLDFPGLFWEDTCSGVDGVYCYKQSPHMQVTRFRVWDKTYPSEPVTCCGVSSWWANGFCMSPVTLLAYCWSSEDLQAAYQHGFQDFLYKML